jgi:hypothetical protein
MRVRKSRPAFHGEIWNRRVDGHRECESVSAGQDLAADFLAAIRSGRFKKIVVVFADGRWNRWRETTCPATPRV